MPPHSMSHSLFPKIPLRPRAARLLRVLLAQCAIASCVVLGVEVALRAGTGAPHGYFEGWFPGVHGLYAENADLVLHGYAPWVIRTNRLGLRGENIPARRVPGFTRVAMVGDSVTDSLFVENESTFPTRTGERLASLGARVEVINAGYGGLTIDRELAVLRELVTGLSPDVVVLTFVTNDIEALEAIDDQALLGQSLGRKVWKHEILRPLAVHTALGERLFDRLLRVRLQEYRKYPWARDPRSEIGPQRYRIPGGTDFEANARIFMERFSNTDGRVLTRDLSPAAERQIGRYFVAWDSFMAHARAHGMEPVFVYFPAYPQVYTPGFPMTIRDVLKRHSDQRGVPFLDLTPAMRAAGNAVLHLAPADFHLNPTGNRVIGEALAEFLIERGRIPASWGRGDNGRACANTMPRP